MPFIESLPTTGPWNAVGLGRGQFLLILAVSVALFVGIDGPVWRHLSDEHLRRLVVSYAAIPLAVTGALVGNRTFTMRNAAGATLVLAAVKLLMTAMLLAVLGMVG